MRTPAADRLLSLLDPGSYRAWHSAVDDGVIAGIGTINGRRLCVWTQDPACRGGSLGVRGGDMIARTLRRAGRAGVPVVGVLHSGGARLQEGVAALSAYGAIFREQSLASVPQISVIVGSCAGGAAYSPALGDFVIMAGDEARMFLTGPRVIKQVTGESVSADALGGPRIHLANGVAHLQTDEDNLRGLVSRLLAFTPPKLGDPPPLSPPVAAPAGDPAASVPSDTRHIYDVRDVIRALVDGDSMLELAGPWARNMVTALAHLDGMPVGVLANQPRYRGGAIDSDASQKGSWFVGLCDRFALPMLVLVDTPGFLPGARQERDGVIRHGASLLRAFAQSTTPRLTVTLRQAYGGAHIVMNSRDLGADLTLAWPSAQVGIMGARHAVGVAERAAIAAGSNPDALAEEYATRNLRAESAAAHGFIHEIVQPADTREHLIAALGLHT